LALIPPERIEHAILLLRGQKVLIDADLAALYAVETKQLVRAVKRNIDRFPDDFAFQITVKEFTNLKRQIGTSSSWGGRRTPPWAFMEQGVAMLSSVLRSKRAVQVNFEIDDRPCGDIENMFDGRHASPQAGEIATAFSKKLANFQAALGRYVDYYALVRRPGRIR
jgi:hypothetical protein